ncbi:MAG: hypothetical protein IJT83_14235 [Victivallales bacterium]|nr:hypothetical protein [Victivallales bacterium]
MFPAPGSTVHVRWYGKTLQGEVVPDDGRIALFASMVHVRVHIQGTSVIAVFSPSHVYATADEVPASTSPHALPAGSPAGSPASCPSPALSSIICAGSAETAAPSPTWSTPDLDAHRARYRQFKDSHWDHEHNHIRIDALEEFYQLFREGVAMRQQQCQKSEPSPILERKTLKMERKPLKPERKQPKIEQIQLSFHFD